MDDTVAENVDRLALVGIIVSEASAVETVNAVLHEYGKSILGRMGLPVRERGVNAISIVIDAPADVINSLTGRLGRIGGVAAKALFQRL